MRNTLGPGPVGSDRRDNGNGGVTRIVLFFDGRVALCLRNACHSRYGVLAQVPLLVPTHVALDSTDIDWGSPSRGRPVALASHEKVAPD